MDANTNKPDPLKAFFQENRDGFEEKMPNKTENWKAIEKALEKTPSAEGSTTERIPAWFWKAASAILFVSCLTLLFRPAPEKELISQRIDVSSELQQTEGYYYSLIASKETSLKELLASMPATDEAFAEEMRQLENTYNQLKEEWKMTQSDKLLHAMIQNLKLRVTYLNRKIVLLEKFKPNKNEKTSANI